MNRRAHRFSGRSGPTSGGGNLSWAKELLDGVEERCAEWHLLKDAVCCRKDWMDEARQHYEAAFRMEPGNPEYKETVKRMRSRKYYHSEGMPAGTLSDNLPSWRRVVWMGLAPVASVVTVRFSAIRCTGVATTVRISLRICRFI